jgi:hypothetical protein
MAIAQDLIVQPFLVTKGVADRCKVYSCVPADFPRRFVPESRIGNDLSGRFKDSTLGLRSRMDGSLHWILL